MSRPPAVIVHPHHERAEMGGGGAKVRTGEGGNKSVGKGQRSNCSSTLTGIDISVDLYIDMQVIFSLNVFTVITEHKESSFSLTKLRAFNITTIIYDNITPFVLL